MKVDTSKMGTKREKIEQSDIDGDFVILTVAGYDEVEVEDRTSALLTFEETGDKVLWLNKSDAETLVEKLGDDSDDWTGQEVPVEKVTRTFKGKKYEKVAVMDAADWDDAFRQAGKRSKGAKKSSGTTATRSPSRGR